MGNWVSSEDFEKWKKKTEEDFGKQQDQRRSDAETIKSLSDAVKKNEEELRKQLEKEKEERLKFQNESLVKHMEHMEQHMKTLTLQFSTRMRMIQGTTGNSHEDSYKMTTVPTGYCLIINNVEFQGSKKSIPFGSTEDANSLERLFSEFGFKVIRQENLTKDQITRELDSLARIDHSSHSCVVVFVLSHGTEEGVLGVDEIILPLHDIWAPFIHVPSLAAKPKLFFIQACAGFRVMRNINGASYAADATPNVNLGLLPLTHADFLIACSTVPGHSSYRNNRGSAYVQKFVNILDKYHSKQDLEQILTTVNREVSSEVGMQMPYKTSSLRKMVFFTKVGPTSGSWGGMELPGPPQ